MTSCWRDRHGPGLVPIKEDLLPIRVDVGTLLGLWVLELKMTDIIFDDLESIVVQLGRGRVVNVGEINGDRPGCNVLIVTKAVVLFEVSGLIRILGLMTRLVLVGNEVLVFTLLRSTVL